MVADKLNHTLGYGCLTLDVNSNKEDIEAFLVAQNVAVRRVHSVKRERIDKVDVICSPEWLPPGETALFVDDDINEHVDPALVAHPQVMRVLFVRGM